MESEPKPADNLPEEDEQTRIKRMNKQMGSLLWEMGWKSAVVGVALAATFGTAAIGYGIYKLYKNKNQPDAPEEPASGNDNPAASPPSAPEPKP